MNQDQIEMLIAIASLLLACASVYITYKRSFG
jgi:hypothetical protein